MEKVLIAGGSGLLGSYLSNMLSENGYEVCILSRTFQDKNNGPVKRYHWNPETKEIDSPAIKDVSYIIQLAGANISEKRWTKKRKNEIINSRINSTDFLFQLTKKNNLKLKAFISASAVGYYGAVNSEHIFQETDIAGTGFLADTTREWENAVNKFNSINIRTVNLRTGIVLSKNGGAFSKMSLSFKFGIATAIGSGKQYFPWIHIEDVCQIYFKAITDEKMKGVYNAVAPVYTTNIEFTRALASKLKNKYLLFYLPSFFLKMIFGELSQAIINGSRISANKILSSGYHFHYNNLENALNDLTNNNK